MKDPVPMSLGRICMALLLCLAVVLSVVACGRNNQNKGQEDGAVNKDNGTPNDGEVSTDPFDDFFDSMEDAEEGATILTYCNKTERSVFAKLKITRIYDDVYIDEDDKAFQGVAERIMLVCNVEEILYGNGFHLNQSIVVPVSLFFCFVENGSPDYRNLDISFVKSFLSEMDYIYVDAWLNSDKTYIAKNDFENEIHTNISPQTLALYELYPVVDGTVSLNRLDNFLDENNIEYLPQSEIYGMDWLCPEGITCSAFEENVKRLSAYFDRKHNE